MKKLDFLFLLLLLGYTATSWSQNEALIGYAFEEVDSLFEAEARPLAVFIHTDWCRFCKNMEQSSLKNEAVKAMLNEGFYFLSLDAEQETAISFRGHSFPFKPNGRSTGVHALAEALGMIDGTLNYPTFVILNTDFEIVFQYSAFLSGKALEHVLRKELEAE